LNARKWEEEKQMDDGGCSSWISKHSSPGFHFLSMFTARAERASHGIGGNPSNSGKEEQMGDHHHDLSPVYHSPCKQNTQQLSK